MRIDAETRLLGIIGFPVRHSISPLMHNSAIEHLKLNYCYVAMEVNPKMLKEAVEGIRALGFVGVNVTVPHKERVTQWLDSISEEAAFVGAVNTIKNDNGILRGYNTDIKGFMKSLEAHGIEISGKRVLLLGAGGAARAVAFYLSKAGAIISIYNRTISKAIALADALKKRGAKVEVKESLQSIGEEIIVNATSLGLKKDDPPPINPALIQKGQIVYDVIYKETTLLREAKIRGAMAIDGKAMLLYQGVEAFKIWTGIEPPVDIMKRAIND